MAFTSNDSRDPGVGDPADCDSTTYTLLMSIKWSEYAAARRLGTFVDSPHSHSTRAPADPIVRSRQMQQHRGPVMQRSIELSWRYALASHRQIRTVTCPR